MPSSPRANPVFPGEGANGVEQMPCERLAAFEFLGYANQLGNIGAAMCKNGARVRELSANSGAPGRLVLRPGNAGRRFAVLLFSVDRQMAPYPMCDREEYQAAPFCTDMRGTLKRLVQAVRAAM